MKSTVNGILIPVLLKCTLSSIPSRCMLHAKLAVSNGHMGQDGVCTTTIVPDEHIYMNIGNTATSQGRCAKLGT